MKNKIIIFAIVIITVLIVSCTPSQDTTVTGQSVVNPKTGTIKIGVLDVFTGDAGPYGITSRRAAEIAADEINAQGGINGKKIELIFEDGKCTGRDAVTAAEKLIEIDQVQVMIGFSCSSMTLGAAPLAEENKVLLFSGYSSNPDISNAGDYIFRNVYSDASSGAVLAEMVLSKAKTVAILTELSDYPKGVEKSFVNSYEPSGKVVAREYFDQASRDFKTQIAKIIATNPEAVIINPQAALTGGLALKQLHDLGYKGSVFANWFLSGNDGLKAAGEFANGVGYPGDPEIPNTEKKAWLFSEYEKRFGEKPAYDYPVASNYDAINILKRAIESKGNDATGIKEYLYTMKPYQGILGSYTFDKNGDMVGVRPIKRMIQDGKPVEFS